MKWSFILLICTGCVIGPKLNKSIYESQKRSLVDSPFGTKSEAKIYPKVQAKVRASYLKDIDSLLLLNTNDTILLVETFRDICVNCPAGGADLWVGMNCLQFSKVQSTYGEYKKKAMKVSDIPYYRTSSMYEDIRFLKNETKLGKDWWNKPESYGTDMCMDGSHRFYTIFLDGEIHTMYIRCWNPKNLD